MQARDFVKDAPGQLVLTLQGSLSFVPSPLPPPLPLPSWALFRRVSEADRALSELAGIGRTLPNPHLLIRSFARREAVASSRIEGTRAGYSDLLLFEIEEEEPPASDVREIANYARALEYGLERLRDLPVSLPLIREMHEHLMQDVRGEDKRPGQFRRDQVWIGPPGCTQETARFVPPPPDAMEDAARDLEKYFHAPSELPPLVRLALIHYQFEAIHPFMDGNGRIGRLLVVLMMCAEGLLSQPLLYLSAFFERNRAAYYDGLRAVSQKAAWSEWIDLFLEGIVSQSRDAVRRSGLLLELRADMRERLQSNKAPTSTLRLLDDLFSHPATSIRGAEKRLGMTYKGAQLALDRLVAHDILHEATGRTRNRIYVASQIVRVLEADDI